MIIPLRQIRPLNPLSVAEVRWEKRRGIDSILPSHLPSPITPNTNSRGKGVLGDQSVFDNNADFLQVEPKKPTP